MSKLTKLMVVLVAIGVLALGGFALWFTSRGDDPLEAELPSIAPTTDASVDTEPGIDSGSTTSPTVTPPSGVQGAWESLPGDGDAFFVGYEIEETLRGIDITSTAKADSYAAAMSIDGETITELDVDVDLTSLHSDESFRDQALKSRGLEIDRFASAAFSINKPVTLGAVPAEGTEVRIEVAGDLTLHGVTRNVTIPVTARWSDDTIDVAGEIGILLADYAMAPPEFPFGSVRDAGKVVFVIRFARS